MEMRLILAMCIVNLGLASATNSRSSRLVAVNDENKTRENFENFFDSIAKKDLERKEVHRQVLKQAAGRERQAFDAMKEELQMARSRNSYREKNLYKKSNVKITAVKRQTYESISSTYPFTKSALKDEQEWVQKYGKSDSQDSDESSESIDNKTTTFDYPTTSSRRPPSTPEPSETPEEDVYIQHFGNDPYAVTKGWKIMREWYREIGEPKMTKMCALAHEKIGFGKNVHVWEASLHIRELIFTNKTYRTRKIDLVSYRIEEGTSIYERRRYWYFTEGIRQDCVFYILPDDPRERQFKLHKQVCGIKVY